MLEKKLDHVICLPIDKKDKIVQDRSNKFFTKMVKGKFFKHIKDSESHVSIWPELE